MPGNARVDLSLEGKVALVTGGGSGLGREMAGALAHAGAELLLVGRHADTLEEAAMEFGSGSRWLAGDLLDPNFYDILASHADRIDIVVNNAGGDVRKGAWLDQSDEDWQVTFELNVLAGMRIAKIVTPFMASRNWGRIINVASVYGFLGQDRRNTQPDMDSGAYIAAKHAVIGFTRFLACRLGDTGVTVNAISPGMFPRDPDDPSLQDKPWKRSDPSLVRRLAVNTPAARNGQPGDLGAAVIFLASPSAAFVTGHNLVVDGGWSVW